MTAELKKAEKGKTVHIHYKGTFSDGKVFDSSEGRDPLAFGLGAGQVIPGFEKAVEGMEVGEKKTVTIKSEDAYGPVRPEMSQEVPRDQLPKDQEPKVGMHLVMQTPEGMQVPARIAKVAEDKVTIDLNHPLAGKDLTFDIELVKVTNEPVKAGGSCGGDCGCEGGKCSGKCADKEGGCGSC